MAECIPKMHVVPWKNREEWNDVYKMIFSDDPQLQENALKRIEVWKCRSNEHGLHASIELSAMLVSFRLHESKRQGSKRLGACSDLCIQSEYSHAVIRFVNLLTDEHQKRKSAIPIHKIADELQIPRWMVELRHQVEYGRIPHISVLREGADFALNYLKKRYWDLQFEEVSEEYIHRTLQNFMEAQGKTCEMKLKPVMCRLERIILITEDTFLNILVRDKYLVSPPNRLADKYRVDPEEFLETSFDQCLPEKLILEWSPLLGLLNKYCLLQKLMVKILTEVSESGNLKDRLLLGWAFAIASAAHGDSSKSKTILCKFDYPCYVDGRSLLRNAMNQKNKFTAAFIPCLFPLCFPSISRERQKDLLEILKLFQSNSDNFEGYYKRLEAKEPPTNENSLPSKKRWRNVSDVFNWANIPTGAIPDKWCGYRLPSYSTSSESTKEFDWIKYPSIEDDSSHSNFLPQKRARTEYDQTSEDDDDGAYGVDETNNDSLDDEDDEGKFPMDSSSLMNSSLLLNSDIYDSDFV